MQEAVDQEVALADLEAGESITFDMPMMLASGETGTKSVTVTAGSWSTASCITSESVIPVSGSTVS